MTCPTLLRRRLIDGAAIIGLALISLYATIRIGLGPRDPSTGVGVIYAPWTPPGEAVARAVGPGARFVRFGGFGFVVVVMPETADYLEKLARTGPLLVVDPRALAACLAILPGDFRT